MNEQKKGVFISNKKTKILYLVISILVLTLSLPSHIFFGNYVMFYSSSEPTPIHEVIKIKENDGDKDVYLTSVTLNESKTVFQHLVFLMDKRMDLKKKIDVSKAKDYTYEQYKQDITESSLNNAVFVAYQHANRKLFVKNEGVLVLATNDNSKILKGDYIQSVNGIVINNLSKLAFELQKYKVNDIITVDLIRKGKNINIRHKLEGKNGKIILGIFAEDYVDIDIPKEVQFNQGNLQGPSAGLMFALYMISALNQEDITKGYKIAGTGEINKDGEIGQIGGIEYKLKGAIEQNIDIFFVPKDRYKSDSNEKNAVEYLSKNKNHLKLVPVSNIQEAIDYLSKL